jgi:hypothetical protein
LHLIRIFDSETDQVVNKITVDATGLDYGTVDDDGLLYFSTWKGSVGTRLALDTPPNAFAVIDPQDDSVKSVTELARVTGGHEAAAMKYVGAGRFVFSVYDETRSDLEGLTAFEISALPKLPDLAVRQQDPRSGADRRDRLDQRRGLLLDRRGQRVCARARRGLGPTPGRTRSATATRSWPLK